MSGHDADRDRQIISERIKLAGASRTYPARSFVFHKGDDSINMMIIESGLARIEHTSRNGRTLLFDLAFAGRLIGELGVIGRQPRSATISTITETTLFVLGAADCRRMLATDNEFQGAILSTVARRTRALGSQLIENSTMDAPGRVAARLVRLVEIEQSLGRSPIDHDGSIDLKLPISQEELGQWAGLSREGTVRGLSTLRASELIETARKRVVIKDIDELTMIARLGA